MKNLTFEYDRNEGIGSNELPWSVVVIDNNEKTKMNLSLVLNRCFATLDDARNMIVNDFSKRKFDEKVVIERDDNGNNIHWIDPDSYKRIFMIKE